MLHQQHLTMASQEEIKGKSKLTAAASQQTQAAILAHGDGLPFVTLTFAQSLDGSICTAQGARFSN